MSNLTYLNDASVLHNLKQRYYHKLIYVSTFDQTIATLAMCRYREINFKLKTEELKNNLRNENYQQFW